MLLQQGDKSNHQNKIEKQLNKDTHTGFLINKFNKMKRGWLQRVEDDKRSSMQMKIKIIRKTKKETHQKSTK